MKSIVKRAFKVYIILSLVHVHSSVFTVANSWGLQFLRACVCEQLNEELKQSLKETMTMKYLQKNYDQVTEAVDKLQQEVRVRATTQAISESRAAIMELKCSPNTCLPPVQVLRQQRLVRLGRKPLHSLGSRGEAGA